MTTIAYDQPVKDFIAGLSATGHVTHTAYRKTSVTFHHNGGRLSHESVLEVWKTRPASAQFDIDGAGSVAQYVKVNEYAWHSGNTEGNKTSIGIELANATLAPDWLVAESTWKSGARLAGWLFARVIGEKPGNHNVKVHHDWKSTLCAGPHIDRIYPQLLSEVQRWYEHFAAAVPKPASPAPAPASPAPTTPGRKSIDQIAREVIAGKWGNNPERAKKLQAAGYVPIEVQAAVNRLASSRAPTARLTTAQLADQVIKGQWGSGAERSRRITAAGYNYSLVQAEVNRKLRGGR